MWRLQGPALRGRKSQPTRALCMVLRDPKSVFPTEYRVFSIEGDTDLLLQYLRKAPCCRKPVCKAVLKCHYFCLVLSVRFYFPGQTLEPLLDSSGRPVRIPQAPSTLQPCLWDRRGLNLMGVRQKKSVEEGRTFGFPLPAANPGGNRAGNFYN